VLCASTYGVYGGMRPDKYEKSDSNVAVIVALSRSRLLARLNLTTCDGLCYLLSVFVIKIKEGIMMTGKITATSKLRNDSPIEMT
jgi:hypothetical protein